MAKEKELKAKPIHYRATVSNTLFVALNTLFMVLFVIITLYPVLNTLAISFNDGTDALRGGIYLLAPQNGRPKTIRPFCRRTT